jgi:hypothetical protein
MIPLIIVLASVLSGAGGVVVGAGMMRHRMESPQKELGPVCPHAWGMWEPVEGRGNMYQQRECAMCGWRDLRNIAAN